MKDNNKLRYMKVTVAILSVLSLSACGWPGGSDNNSSSSGNGSNTVAQTPAVTVSVVPYNNSSVYTSDTDGSRYVAIQVSYTAPADANPVTVSGVSLSGEAGEPTSIVEDTSALVSNANVTGTAVYNNLTPCVQGTSLSPGQSCYVFLHADLTTANLFGTSGAYHQTLTINNSLVNQAVAINTMPYVYVSGIFDQIGGASVPTGDLLAKCHVDHFDNSGGPVLACENVLAGTQPYANGDVYRVAFNDAGKLYAAGSFNQIGDTSLSSDAPANAAMLASCTPTTADTSVSGGSLLSCSNVLTNSSTPYANAHFGAISIGSDNKIYVGGKFSAIDGIDAGSGHMLVAACDATTGACTDALNGQYANDEIQAITQDGSGNIYIGGWFDQLGSINLNDPENKRLLAKCSFDSQGNATCVNLLGDGSSNYAAGNILGLSTGPSLNVVTNTEVLAGGVFSNIGGASSSDTAMVAKCNMQTGSCTNALSGSSGADGYIYAVKTNSQADFYAGGTFKAIGGANPVTSGYMLAHCNFNGDCTNALGDDANKNFANHRIDSIQANVEIAATVNSGS